MGELVFSSTKRNRDVYLFPIFLLVVCWTCFSIPRVILYLRVHLAVGRITELVCLMPLGEVLVEPATGAGLKVGV